MERLTKVIIMILICSILLTSCSSDISKMSNEEIQIGNLEKLCKVWGYTKYYHPVFLYGEKDWDEELFSLIPKVMDSKSEKDTNKILLNWFNELGEIDYRTTNAIPEWKVAKEEDKIIQADTDWIKDIGYLGEELSKALSQFDEIPSAFNTKSLVFFNEFGIPQFENEKIYEDMDYTDVNYKILSLFRFWNGVEYYYPYLDILDENWHDLLTEYTPRMLETTDKHSFEQTMASISAKLQDAHVQFLNLQSPENIFQFQNEEFGKYTVPAYLTKAEGKYVINKIESDYIENSNLKIGDIPVEVDGVKIEDIIKNRKEFISLPEDNKILKRMSCYILSSKNEIINLKVLRDNKEINIDVKGMPCIEYGFMEDDTIYKIFDNNIGYINPNKIEFEKIDETMKKLENTIGLIVDLRNFPSGMGYALEKYLYDSPKPFRQMSVPSKAIPGVFLKNEVSQTQFSTDLSYRKPVIVLIDERTQSMGETVTMGLREAENVIVMGENSIGANGNVVVLPLPSNNVIYFSSLGVYTHNGEQTQRIGLSPDIYIEKTIEGIKKGRDEYIEEATSYILENAN